MTNLVEKQMGASIIVNTGTKSFFQSLEHGRIKKTQSVMTHTHFRDRIRSIAEACWLV